VMLLHRGGSGISQNRRTQTSNGSYELTDGAVLRGKSMKPAIRCSTVAQHRSEHGCLARDSAACSAGRCLIRAGAMAPDHACGARAPLVASPATATTS
jgi:hypothetical protein